MYKIKFLTSIIIFSILLSITSLIKTNTRIIEKKIYKKVKGISLIKKDLHETQLDYFYLSSPNKLSKRIKEFAHINYTPMDLSRIYLNYNDFVGSKKKLTTLKKDKNEEKTKKK